MYYATSCLQFIVVVTLIFTQAVYTKSLPQPWRSDENYEPWPMRGVFIKGTPKQCTAPEPPLNGRWICSYGSGENGRSLCMVDCQRDFIIESKPVIFNCEYGQWRLFPSQGLINLPQGNCVSIQEFLG